MDNIKDKQKNIPPQPKKPGKWSVVGKFLKDASHFIFDEDKASDEVKRDLLALEMTKAEEKAAAKLAKAKAETEAKIKLEAEKLAKMKAENEAKAKQDEIKKKAENEAKAKLFSIKLKSANRFKHEMDEILKHKQAAAEKLLKDKQVKPTKVVPEAHHGFGFFKDKHDTEPLKSNVPMPAVKAEHPVESLPIETDKNLGAHPGEHKEKSAQKFQEERLKHETVNQREQIENRAWQPYNMVATNLIREQRSMFLNWQGKILLLALFVAMSALICLLAYGFLIILEKDKLNSNDYVFKNLESIVVQIKKEESYAQEILKFNDKLLVVDYLLKNHIYWTGFFKFLEDNTIKDVYYESFSGDTAGKYTMPAVAKDYSSISMQLKVLQAAADKVISVDSGGAATEKPQTVAADNSAASSTPNAKVNFNLNLNLNRSIFIKEPEYE